LETVGSATILMIQLTRFNVALVIMDYSYLLYRLKTF